MQQLLNIVIVFLLCISIANSAKIGRKLPRGLVPCHLNDPDLDNCVLKHATDAIPYISKGIPSYNMLPMDPMRISEIVVDDRESNSRLALAITMRDAELTGLGNTRLKKMIMNPTNPRVVWSGFAPKLQMIGEYDIAGRILILPITGTGPMNITLDNVDFIFEFNWEKGRVRQGKTYLNLTDNRVKFAATGCNFQLDNLFNGDKALGDNMNKFLNENCQILIEDLGPSIGEAINMGFTQVFKTLLQQVPYEEMFIN